MVVVEGVGGGGDVTFAGGSGVTKIEQVRTRGEGGPHFGHFVRT